MRQVDVTADLRASREAVLDALGPEALIRLEGTYEVDSVREADGGWIVTASTIVNGEVVEMTLSVDELENGYAYELVEGGFFEELHTTILVSEPPEEVRAEIDEPELTRVTLRSTFTFGGLFASVKDWFATSNRRTELRRAVARLGEEVADGEKESRTREDEERKGEESRIREEERKGEESRIREEERKGEESRTREEDRDGDVPEDDSGDAPR